MSPTCGAVDRRELLPAFPFSIVLMYVLSPMIGPLRTLLLAICGVTTAAGVTQQDFALPAPAVLPATAIDLWATHYHIHRAREMAAGYPLRDQLGKALTGNLSPADWCLGAIEGTVQIASNGASRGYNYAGRSAETWVDCADSLKIDPARKPWISAVGRTVFAPTVGPFGDGAKHYILVPYRTLAVDPEQIPFGTVLYIPEARGASINVSRKETLQHDGYFFAGDAGGAIKGKHVDVFCGMTTSNCAPSFVSSNPSASIKAYIVTDASIVTHLTAMHSQRR
jgi:3D (Asp-Asp-Asp) domain-containing protein